jgi:hypothetical protein
MGHGTSSRDSRGKRPRLSGKEIELEQLAKEWNPVASHQPSAVSILFLLMAGS